MMLSNPFKIKCLKKARIANDLHIKLCDSNGEVADILANVFSDLDHVSIYHGDIFNVKADAIVSPANSFGDMSGGLDLAIQKHFRFSAEKSVQQIIRQKYFGELPVGMSEILKMNCGRFMYLIISPTMRIPGKIRSSINAYLSMRGTLVALRRFNELNSIPIKSAVMPSLGTGVGGMIYQDAAEQMKAAYDNIMNDSWKTIVHPAMAPYNIPKR